MEQVRLGIIGVGNMGTGHALSLMAGDVPEMALTVVEDFPTTDIALLRKERNLLASKRISNPVAVTLV